MCSRQRARRKGVLGKLYEIQISPERGLHNSLNFPSYFGMECAALEYGQEIARIIYGNITRIYSKYHMIIYGNAIRWWFGT